MNEINYCVEILTSKLELEQIAKMLTARNAVGLPYKRDRRKDRRNHFRKFGDSNCDGLREVSEKFPDAIFLLEEVDSEYSWAQEIVYRNGREIKSAVQPGDWTPLSIFMPFKLEFSNHMPVGSTWKHFLSEVEAQIKRQKTTMEEETRKRRKK